MRLVVWSLMLALVFAPTHARAAAPYLFRGTLQRGQTLEVRDINGAVAIVPGKQLVVRATKTTVRANPDDVRIVRRSNANGMMFCVRYPGANAATTCADGMHDRHAVRTDNDTRVDFEVTVPSGVRVRIATVNGEVNVKSDALVAARTVNGKIAIEAGDVTDAVSVNGAVDIRVHDAASTKPMHVSTLNGSLTITLPRTAGYRVHAAVLNGDIIAGGLTVTRPKYGPGARLDGKIGDGRRALDLHALNGSIAIERL